MGVRIRATLIALVVLLAGCAGSGGRTPAGGHSSAATCTPPAGGRCPGPIAVPELAVENSGRRLVGVFMCGGRFTGRETSMAVFVTYVASAVGAGGMSCARVKLSVTLDQPLDNRRVIDTTSRRPVPITLCHPGRGVPTGDPLNPCW